MFDGLLEKLMETQQKMQKAKDNLDNIVVESSVEGGAVKVQATAAKRIVNITISENILTDYDKESLEDLLVTAVNRALEDAGKRAAKEIKDASAGMPNMPNIPGMSMPNIDDMF